MICTGSSGYRIPVEFLWIQKSADAGMNGFQGPFELSDASEGFLRPVETVWLSLCPGAFLRPTEAALHKDDTESCPEGFKANFQFCKKQKTKKNPPLGVHFNALQASIWSSSGQVWRVGVGSACEPKHSGSQLRPSCPSLQWFGSKRKQFWKPHYIPGLQESSYGPTTYSTGLCRPQMALKSLLKSLLVFGSHF